MAERHADEVRDDGVTLARHRFTVAEYERMGALGLFGAEARVELIAVAHRGEMLASTVLPGLLIAAEAVLA